MGAHTSSLQPTVGLETRVWKRILGVSLGFLGIALLFVGLRWNSYNAPLTRDEGEYAYSAWLLKQGIAPYQNAFLQKPPMVVYSYLLAELLAPRWEWFPRVVAGVSVALTTILLGAIARREFGKGCGLVAMWLVTPMILLPQLEQFTANTEMFLLLPLLGAIAIYVFVRNQSQGWHWLCAGFLGAIAVLYKFTVVPVLLFGFAAWSYDEWKGKPDPGRLLKRWLFCAAGALVASLTVLAFFLKTDGGRSLWDCVVVFNRYYGASNQFLLAALRSRLGDLFSAWWVLFLLPVAFVWQRPSRIWFWLTLTVLAFASSTGSWYGHYYVPVMPFWAVTCAAAINVIVSWFPSTFPVSADWIRRSMATIVVVLICLPDARQVALSRQEFQTRIYPFYEATTVATRLAQITSPGDRVLIAGSEPQILYGARRLSSTRFVLLYPLMIPTPLAEGYQREAIREVEERPPAAIVVARSNASWLEQPSSPKLFQDYLIGLLNRDYQLVGGYVANGERGLWEEPLSDARAGQSSLLLFRRNTPQFSPDANAVSSAP